MVLQRLLTANVQLWRVWLLKVYATIMPLSASNPSVERCIVWQDGSSLEVVRFAQRVIAKWEELFVTHGIRP